MQSKSKALASLLGAGICAIFALGTVAVQAQDQKIDPNGTWKWTQPGRNGGPDREFSLTLKDDGSKLTGSLTAPGRGGDPVSTDISNGKITGDQIAFELVRDTQNGSVTNKYAGKIAGDTITGTQPGGRRRGGGNGGGNGGGGGGMAAGGTNAPDGGTPPPPPAPTTRPWTATRSK